MILKTTFLILLLQCGSGEWNHDRSVSYFRNRSYAITSPAWEAFYLELRNRDFALFIDENGSFDMNLVETYLNQFLVRMVCTFTLQFTRIPPNNLVLSKIGDLRATRPDENGVKKSETYYHTPKHRFIFLKLLQFFSAGDIDEDLFETIIKDTHRIIYDAPSDLEEFRTKFFEDHLGGLSLCWCIRCEMV